MLTEEALFLLLSVCFVLVSLRRVGVLMQLFILTVGSIPDEAKALSLLAPANAVAGMMPGGGLLPTPNPMPNPAVSLQMHILIHICDLMWKNGCRSPMYKELEFLV